MRKTGAGHFQNPWPENKKKLKRIKNDTIIAQTLDVAPEGCEEY